MTLQRQFREWTSAVSARCTPRARVIASALWAFIDERGRCWPSLATLGELAHYSENTVRLAVQELRTKGFLLREIVPNKRRCAQGMSSVYQLVGLVPLGERIAPDPVRPDLQLAFGFLNQPRDQLKLPIEVIPDLTAHAVLLDDDGIEDLTLHARLIAPPVPPIAALTAVREHPQSPREKHPHPSTVEEKPKPKIKARAEGQLSFPQVFGAARLQKIFFLLPPPPAQGSGSSRSVELRSLPATDPPDRTKDRRFAPRSSTAPVPGARPAGGRFPSESSQTHGLAAARFTKPMVQGFGSRPSAGRSPKRKPQ